MNSSIRLLAAAATVAAAVLPAQAAPLLSLGFDDLTTPLGLNGKVFSTSSGQAAITFGSDATAKTANTDPLYDGPPERNGAGQPANVFVVNDAISFKIDVAPGFKVDMLTLDFATTNQSVAYTVTDRDGGVFNGTVVGTSAAWTWSDNVDAIGLWNVGLFESIQFSSNGLFAIDNLRFDLSTCTPNCGSTGSNVPEPASFGLMSIALLGAGLSSRRRRQAGPA